MWSGIIECRFLVFVIFEDIPIHALVAQLGASRCKALPLFHALTGCDTVSHFMGCGKKTAWSAWQNTPNLTDTLVAVTSDPKVFNQQSEHMHIIERFVVVMYSKASGLDRVNEARLQLFSSGKKSLEALPPTQAALYPTLYINIFVEQFCKPLSGVRQLRYP